MLIFVVKKKLRRSSAWVGGARQRTEPIMLNTFYGADEAKIEVEERENLLLESSTKIETFINKTYLQNQMVEPRNTGNFYERLGVGKDASPDAIKAAYRSQAFNYHPDRDKGTYAEDNFKALGEAYDTLRDRRRRKIYDSTQFVGGFSFSRGGDSATDYMTNHEGVYQRTRTRRRATKVKVGNLELRINNTFEQLMFVAGGFYGAYQGVTGTVGASYDFFHDNLNFLYFDSLAWASGTMGAIVPGIIPAGLVVGSFALTAGGVAGLVAAKTGTAAYKGLESILSKKKDKIGLNLLTTDTSFRIPYDIFPLAAGAYMGYNHSQGIEVGSIEDVMQGIDDVLILGLPTVIDGLVTRFFMNKQVKLGRSNSSDINPEVIRHVKRSAVETAIGYALGQAVGFIMK